MNRPSTAGEAENEIVVAPRAGEDPYPQHGFPTLEDEAELGAPIAIAPPWSRSLLAFFVLLIAAAIVLGVVCRVEVTDRARGIVRPAAGVRPLLAQTDGVVTEVCVRSGDRVSAGTPLVRLQSAETSASLLEATRDVEVQGAERARLETQADFVRQRDALKLRLESLRQQNASLEGSVAHHERRMNVVANLQKSGLVSPIDADDARERHQEALRSLQSGREALFRTEQELASIEAAHERDVWEAGRRLNEAQARRDGLAFPMQRAVIHAPTPGVVEAVLLRRGDFVRSGQTVGKLLPDAGPLLVIAFVPEKDRAFIRAGDVARLELDQFPHTEFGTVRARVVRVSSDLVSRYEIEEAMGEAVKIDVPSYRVELQAIDARPRIEIRAGMLLHVRLTLRRQRLLAMLFEPLARISEGR